MNTDFRPRQREIKFIFPFIFSGIYRFSSSIFFLCQRKFLLLWVMAKGEETPAFGGVETARVAMSSGEVVVGGEVEGLAMGVGVEAKQEEPLLPLQDLWYHLTSLFPIVRDIEVSPPSTLKKWILKVRPLP